MHPTSRRRFLGDLAGLAGTLWLTSASPAAAARARRKYTLDLVCGAIGVQANQRQAIAWARQAGFESVQPVPQELALLSESDAQELAQTLREARLTWGAAGLPVEFRRDEAAFTRDVAALPALAQALQRAGASRVGTWLSPSHDELTYTANLAQHARRLREVAKILADHGQRLGLEYVGPKTLWSAKRFPFRMSSPAI